MNPAPDVGEFLIDTSGVHVEICPDLAFNGTNFLVVWEDYRSGSDLDIYGARLTQAGVVLDTAGIAISTAANHQMSPAVSFDGANFLVVWTDLRDSSGLHIYGARVTPAGVVLDTSGIVISNGQSPAVAFDGANFLVVWMDLRSVDFDIYGSRVTPAGVVLDPAGIAISTAAYDQWRPALALDVANFLVVWGDSRDGSGYDDIYGSRVTPGGVVLDSGPVVMQDSSQVYPKLAHGSGSQMFLVYQGWASSVGGKTYNTQRVWGKMNPSPAVAEMTKREVRMTYSGATIIRGVMFLPETSSLKSQAASLLDISGRKVLDLHPGANYVRRLSPGVYFIRQAQAQSTGKVVIAR